MIDLRSDTVTRPTPAMRDAMASAEVGDDVYGEDPTVNALQAKVAEVLGKEAALYCPSGTMANQLAIKAWTRPGDEVCLEGGGHSYNFETGATAAVAGVQVRPITGARGVFTADQLDAAIRPSDDHFPRTSLVCLENTHNFGGGTVWPLETFEAVAARGHARGLSVHLDGARLFNAVVASGITAEVWASHVDSVSVCLSKGLGAPVGSVVAGSADFIREVHRLRKMFGGGMRQAGILAAAGLHALDHHVDRLAEDHARARRLAEALDADVGYTVDPTTIDTNIVFVDTRRPAAEVTRALADREVLVSATGPHQLRLVTHLDVSDADLDGAIEAMVACG